MILHPLQAMASLRFFIRAGITGVSAAIVAGMVFGGCAGYRLGPTGGQQAGARTIKVTPIVNNTIEARLGDPITHALRKRLQQDGTFRLVSSGQADVLLTGSVVSFMRDELSYQPNDLLTVRDYNLSMTVHIKAEDKTNGKVLLNRNVIGVTTMRAGSDLASAERQAIPLIAEDIARKATILLTEGEW